MPVRPAVMNRSVPPRLAANRVIRAPEGGPYRRMSAALEDEERHEEAARERAQWSHRKSMLEVVRRVVEIIGLPPGFSHLEVTVLLEPELDAIVLSVHRKGPPRRIQRWSRHRVPTAELAAVWMSKGQTLEVIKGHVRQACWTFENEPALRDGGRGLW